MHHLGRTATMLVNSRLLTAYLPVFFFFPSSCLFNVLLLFSGFYVDLWHFYSITFTPSIHTTAFSVFSCGQISWLQETFSKESIVFVSVQTKPSCALVFLCCFPFNKVFTFGFSLVVPRTQQSRNTLSCFHLWLKLKLCKELTFWRQFNSVFLFPRQNWDKTELCCCSYRLINT